MYCSRCRWDYGLEDPASADQNLLATYFVGPDNLPLRAEACSLEEDCHSFQAAQFSSFEVAEMSDPELAFADAFPCEASSLDPDYGAVEMRID